MIDSRLGRLWKAVRLGCWWELGRIHSRINGEGGGGGGLGSGEGGGGEEEAKEPRREISREEHGGNREMAAGL